MDLQTTANHLLNLGKGLLLVLLPLLIPFFLSEPVRRYYGYFIDVSRNADCFVMVMKLLGSKMIDLPQPTKATAKTWADGVKCLQKEADEFKNAYESWKHKSFLPKAWWRYGIAVRAGLLLEKAEFHEKVSMDEERQRLPLAILERDAIDTVPGLEPLLEEALTYLQDPGPRVIGIYGVGGIGKTTLLNKINNFLALMPDNGFHHVIWVTASREVHLENLQEDIAQRLGLSLLPMQGVQQRADVIRDYMKDKSFLLLLDDLWKPLELEALGIPNPQEGSSQLLRKVVFTTRSEKVCDSMQAMDTKRKRIKVAFLSEGHAWQLFKMIVGETFNDSDREVENLARAVAKQCGGLPLALKVIGVAMSNRKSLQDWEDALESLKESKSISGTEEGIFHILKHSYDYLNDDRIRECFLCCALWPEDFGINKDTLTRCWMGLGLISRRRVDEKYRVGREYIQTLKAVSLLEAGPKEDRQVKLHSVIRDMALQIVSGKHKWMVQAGVWLEEAPRDMEQWGAVEQVSLRDNSIKNLPTFRRDGGSAEAAIIFHKLSTLMLQRNYLSKIPRSFFPCMPNLTYLDLSRNFDLKELPREICELTSLRYLNLTLTDIRSLPQELGRLEKLFYLYLCHTKYLNSEVTLEMMPKSLQVLDLFASSIKWEAEGENILRGLESLEVLGITVRSTTMLEMLSKLSHVHLQSICIRYNASISSLDINRILKDFGHIRNHLQYLKISDLFNLKELKVDFGDEGGQGTAWNLWKLEVLHVHCLWKLKRIIWRGIEAKDFLPRHRSLKIFNCYKLENVSWVLQLQCLEDLQVSWCHQMKMLIDRIGITEGTTDLAFPRLKLLYLKDLPNLEDIYRGGLALPSLEAIHIYDCPKLGSLPFRWPLTNSKMRQIYGTQEWWDGLQWEDERIRIFLQRHFVSLSGVLAPGLFSILAHFR